MSASGYQFSGVTPDRLDELMSICTKRLKADDPVLVEGIRRRRRFLNGRLNQGWGAFTVQHEGELIGLADFLPLRAATVDIAGSSQAYYLQCLCIDSAHRGKGLEDKLLELVEDEVRARGGKALVAVAYDGGDHMPLPFFGQHQYTELDSRDELHLMVKWFGEPLSGRRQRPHWLSVRQRLKHGLVVVTSDLCPYNLYTVANLAKVVREVPGVKVRVLGDGVRGAGRLTTDSLVYAGGVLVAVGPVGPALFRRALCPRGTRGCGQDTAKS